MSFQRTFDELLNALLTDYKNQFPQADTSQGSLIFIKCSALASALWGLYEYQTYLSRQIFPDTADSESLEHHASIRGLPRKPEENDAALLARLLDYIRRPPAGGNKSDYVKWATSITGVSAAYCFPLALGLGTVDVVVVADSALTGSEVPSVELLAEVKDYLDSVRPVTARSVRVLAPTLLPVDITMLVSGPANLPQIASDITVYLNGLIPGQPLYMAQLTTLAVQNGADSAIITAPGGTIAPLTSQIVRPGVINVA
jgi:uncharacterized phage protein gp47/JayE